MKRNELSMPWGRFWLFPLVVVAAWVMIFWLSDISRADGYVYDRNNGYYWKDGVPYTRTGSYPCSSSHTGYCYKYYPVPNYTARLRAAVPSYDYSNRSINYSYEFNYAQPATLQGNTQYGLPFTELQQQGYPNVDLGQLLASRDYAFRMSQDANTTYRDSAERIDQYAQSISAYKHEENMRLLDLQEKQLVANALKEANQARLSIRQYSVQGQTGSPHAPQTLPPKAGNPPGDGGASVPGQWGPLVTQYCMNCHGQGKEAYSSFAMEEIFTFEGYALLQDVMTTDDAARRMPKGQEIDPNTRGAILGEINQTVLNYLKKGGS